MPDVVSRFQDILKPFLNSRLQHGSSILDEATQTWDFIFFAKNKFLGYFIALYTVVTL